MDKFKSNLISSENSTFGKLNRLVIKSSNVQELVVGLDNT